MARALTGRGSFAGSPPIHAMPRDLAAAAASPPADIPGCCCVCCCCCILLSSRLLFWLPALGHTGARGPARQPLSRGGLLQAVMAPPSCLFCYGKLCKMCARSLVAGVGCRCYCLLLSSGCCFLLQAASAVLGLRNEQAHSGAGRSACILASTSKFRLELELTQCAAQQASSLVVAAAARSTTAFDYNLRRSV